MSALTPVEIELLRFHLGYGNLQVGSFPWTPDGFMELFTNVIGPNLSDGAETSATTAITIAVGSAPAIATVTPADMTGIAVNVRLVVDNGDDTEVVAVKAVSDTTFSARFSRSHDVTGYPIAVETGTSRLRMLLHEADRVHALMLGPLTTSVAGLQSVDKGEVVWCGQHAVLKGQLRQYETIVASISSLVRVAPVGGASGPTTQLEAY